MREKDEFGGRFRQVGVSLSDSHSLSLDTWRDEVRVIQQFAQLHRDVVTATFCQRKEARRGEGDVQVGFGDLLSRRLLIAQGSEGSSVPSEDGSI